MTGSDGNTVSDGRPGRHPGVQPPLHPSTADGGTTRSNGGSSTLSGTTHDGNEKPSHGDASSPGHANTTTFNEKGGGAAGPGSGNNEDSSHAVNAKKNGDGSAADINNEKASSNDNTNSRPPISHRESSNDASRWRAFTLPMKYRKMLDEYTRARSEHEGPQGSGVNQNQNQPHPDPSSHHHFFGAHHNIQEEPVEDASDIDSDESIGDYHYRYFGRKKRRRGSNSRQASGDDSAGPAYDEDGNPIRTRLPRRHTNNRQHQSSRRSSWDRSRNNARQQQQQRGSGTATGEGINMAPHATNMSRHNSAMGAGGWNSPWLPHAGADPESNIPGSLHFPGLTSGHNHLDELGVSNKHAKIKTKTQQFRRWVVRSAFAPLAFRMMNLAFTASLLGVAVVSLILPGPEKPFLPASPKRRYMADGNRPFLCLAIRASVKSHKKTT